MSKYRTFHIPLILGLICILYSCSSKKMASTSNLELKYRYEVNLNQLIDDKLKVELLFTGIKKQKDTFCFPKIVPGIYGSMDFGQYIESISVKDKDGVILKSKKIDANCWEISEANKIVSIEYEVDDTWEEFDLEMKRGFYKSAASSFKKEVFILNSNCIFGYFNGQDNIPIELVIKKPESLYGATSLNKVSSGEVQDKFELQSYHELVDNPIMYSKVDTTHIRLPNIDIEVACYSSSGESISSKIADYIKPLLKNQTEYLGGKLPVDKYTFILYHNLNPDQYSYLGDGLEHSHSTLILLYMPMDIDVIKDNVYGIASHEFFHTLMPLGIHSQEIADYDFNNPQFSRHLWLYEGMTEYFTIHMPIKNGIQDLPDFIEVLERKMTEMKSFDNKLSFTELSLNPMEYQDQYYNVYLKGTFINLCLDIELRNLSNGTYGVQDLVNELIERYGINEAFEDEKLFDEIVSITGFSELSDFFNQYVIGSNELPLKSTLEKVGLTMVNEKIVNVDNLSTEQKVLRKFWINK